MRHTFLLLLAFLFMTIPQVSAQDTKPELMVDAGLNVSNETRATPGTGFSASARLRFPFSERGGISTGLSYTTRNFDLTGLFFGSGVDPRAGLRCSTDLYYRYGTVGLPLIVEWRIFSSPLIIDAGFGTGINMVVRNRTVFDECGQITQSNARLRPFADLILQSRVGLPVGNKIFLYLQPTVQRSISVFGPSVGNILTLSGSFGIGYRF